MRYSTCCHHPIYLELLKSWIKVAIEVVHEVNQLWESYWINESTVKSTLKVKHVKLVLPQLLSSHLWDRWSQQCLQRRWSRNQSSPRRPGGYQWFYLISTLKNLFQLDVPDDGEREEVVESFLRLHLLLVELLHLLNHLLGKNLRINKCNFVEIALNTNQPPCTRWGNEPVSRWEHSWQRSRRAAWWSWESWQS